ncbi:hypothetical protein vseg_007637 [Gypsophila vaccaria]
MAVTSPSPEEQRQIVKALILEADSNLKEGNFYYVVSYRWFQRWQIYSGLDVNGYMMCAGSPDLPNELNKPGPIDNSDLVSNSLASHPDSLDLIRTLEEGRDYALVPEDVWNKLLEWYGGGPSLPRKLILHGSIHKKFNVEVYPLTLKLIDTRDNSEEFIRISKKATIFELCEKVGALKGLPQNKVCIWDYFNNRKNSILDSSSGKTLEDANLEMDQHILLEVQERLMWSIPDLLPSLNHSLRLLSTFRGSGSSFSPITPPPNIDSVYDDRKGEDGVEVGVGVGVSGSRGPPSKKAHHDSTGFKERGRGSLRTMLASCLLERTPFQPIHSSMLLRKLERDNPGVALGDVAAVEAALRSMSQSMEVAEDSVGLMVMSIDPNALLRELPPTSAVAVPNPNPNAFALRTAEETLKDVEDILNKKSFKETLKSQAGQEIFDLLHRSTARERAIADKFKTKGGPQLQHYCLALTKEDCRLKSASFIACDKVHFRRIIAPHTDVNLGDCSFLDTCRHMKTCKYVHYELDPTSDMSPMMGTLAPPKPLKTQRAEYCSEVELGESQWISCDIRNFRMDILGQFGVIMADPPWDIHMELPYGTMADDEMRTLNVPALQTDGLIFLWVTGRAMELGRECLELWGYKRVEEIIWVKTNQLQRIIRTGRTGHWLNHSKEHCLVGIKGNPLVNRNIDTDVIVAEVRETSRKPDEMYPLLERISPRTRKLELFARMHNTQSGWLSLGNQLNGVRLVDEGLRARFKAAYPDVEVQPTSPPRSCAMEMEPGVRTPFSGTETNLVPPQLSQPATGNVSEGKPCSSQDVC